MVFPVFFNFFIICSNVLLSSIFFKSNFFCVCSWWYFAFVQLLKIPHICKCLICQLIQLTPYSTVVPILHQSFFSLCLDVSWSCGQNIEASHNGISFCGGNMCVPGDTTMAFCVLLCQASGTDSYHPHIAFLFLQRACSKLPVCLECSQFTERMTNSEAIA